MLQGAQVAVTQDSVTRTVATDAKGFFELRVPRGRARFEASYPGFAPKVVREHKYSGNPVGHTFYLRPLDAG